MQQRVQNKMHTPSQHLVVAALSTGASSWRIELWKARLLHDSSLNVDQCTINSVTTRFNFIPFTVGNCFLLMGVEYTKCRTNYKLLYIPQDMEAGLWRWLTIESSALTGRKKFRRHLLQGRRSRKWELIRRTGSFLWRKLCAELPQCAAPRAKMFLTEFKLKI